MFDIMGYAEKNDVEVSVRKGCDGRTEWEIFLKDRRLGVTEFVRIIDIEIRGRLDKDEYILSRCEEMMERIRSARKNGCGPETDHEAFGRKPEGFFFLEKSYIYKEKAIMQG